MQNAVHALYLRHLLPNVRPCKDSLKTYDAMVKRWFNEMVPKVVKGIMQEDVDLMKILESKDWEKGKKCRYYSNCM